MNQPQAGRKRGWHRLRELILTTDKHQRHRARMVLATAVLYAACLALFGYGIVNGIFAAASVRLPATLVAITPLVFYAIIRSGLNLRFAEPSLAFPQALVAQALLSFTYPALEQIRAVTLVLMVIVMCFGNFDMGTRKVRIVMVYSIVVMGSAMAWSAWTDAAAHPLHIELFYFAVMCVALPSVASLSVQLSAMRDRLKRQKQELQAALAKIQLVATHDELTKLANRRHMITLLGEHILRHGRGGPGFVVALADIDHFKNVNDTHGHRVGDEALVTFATQARAQLRNTDIVARWGGEEFLLLLPETVPGDPNVGVERLRGALAVAQASAHAPHLRIAFSTGLTRYIAGEEIDDMIERADRALYQAKASGRNRTVVL
jgi:diguanylate cyclase (GGDEF)-like protein